MASMNGRERRLTLDALETRSLAERLNVNELERRLEFDSWDIGPSAWKAIVDPCGWNDESRTDDSGPDWC